jgi:hypothetical protein
LTEAEKRVPELEYLVEKLKKAWSDASPQKKPEVARHLGETRHELSKAQKSLKELRVVVSDLVEAQQAFTAALEGVPVADPTLKPFVSKVMVAAEKFAEVTGKPFTCFFDGCNRSFPDAVALATHQSTAEHFTCVCLEIPEDLVSLRTGAVADPEEGKLYLRLLQLSETERADFLAQYKQQEEEEEALEESTDS